MLYSCFVQPLHDPNYRVVVQAVQLKRQVEMYQWVESHDSRFVRFHPTTSSQAYNQGLSRERKPVRFNTELNVPFSGDYFQGLPREWRDQNRDNIQLQ